MVGRGVVASQDFNVRLIVVIIERKHSRNGTGIANHTRAEANGEIKQILLAILNLSSSLAPGSIRIGRCCPVIGRARRC